MCVCVTDRLRLNSECESSVISPEYVLELLGMYGYDASPFDFETTHGQNHIIALVQQILLDHRMHQQQREEAAAKEAAHDQRTSDLLSKVQRLKVEVEDLKTKLFSSQDAFRYVEVCVSTPVSH